MRCTPSLLMFLCLPLFLATANATIIVSTSSDLQGCGGPGAPPCPPPPMSTFKGGLIINGDFGDGNFTGYSGTATQNKDRSQGGVQGDAYHAYSGVYLASAGSDQTLYQTFSTKAGDTYSISFYLDNFDQGDGGSPTYDFNASFGDQMLLSFANPALPIPQLGKTFTFQAVANSSTTTLLFSARNDPGTFDLTNIAVDDTTTAVTPEPSSLVLLGTGVLSLLWLGRRQAYVFQRNSARFVQP